MQYKFNCCNMIAPAAKNYGRLQECPTCGKQNPIYEEVDKEDEVFVAPVSPFSGDKSFEAREWGSFKVLLDEEYIKVKKIVVNSGKRLSLQLHKKRDEHWFVVSGFGTLELNGESFDISSGDSFDIKKYQTHRVRASGLNELVIIETQTGVCQEDDIIRIEDDYGRV
mgnify:FL=1